MKLTTAQIGRARFHGCRRGPVGPRLIRGVREANGQAGELLVQEQLLLHGVESAPLTTDTGIDLVAYSPRRADAVTIQVKANLQPKPGGGKGKPALDW